MKKFIIFVAIFMSGFCIISCKLDSPVLPENVKPINPTLSDGHTMNEVKQNLLDLNNGVNAGSQIVIKFDTARTDYYDTVSHPGLKLNYYWEYYGQVGFWDGELTIHKDTSLASLWWTQSGAAYRGFALIHTQAYDVKTWIPQKPATDNHTPFYQPIPTEKLGCWMYFKIYHAFKLVAKDSVYLDKVSIAALAPYDFNLGHIEPNKDNITFSVHY